jgi:Cupin-like domain
VKTPAACAHSTLPTWGVTAIACRGSRSSLHYDPYQNLLCVVRGSKLVRLHSPEQTSALYPKPAYGEVRRVCASSIIKFIRQEPAAPTASWAVAKGLCIASCIRTSKFLALLVKHDVVVASQAANHSSVNFAAPDLARHPAYAQALEHQLTAELQVMPSEVIGSSL